MRRKLLVVDDVRANRHILSRMLIRDYVVLEAENGVQAMEILNREGSNISVVLLDLMMPEMDGFEVLSRMRDAPSLSTIPALVMTSASDVASEVRALELGATDFIVKPYVGSVIKRRVANVIKLRETFAVINVLQRDSVTSLYNRETFFEKAAEMISKHESGYYVLACFDVDSFKVVNDHYGTSVGDKVLRHIGKVIERYVDDKEGICCRVMADNFAMLFPQRFVDDEGSKSSLAEASRPKCIDQEISIKTGYYIIDDLKLTVSAMYDRAMLALSSIKGMYDKHVQLYDESMRTTLISEQVVVSEMSTALRDRQFEVWFQPQYNLSSGALIGAEALVRWHHPKRGYICPGSFIPVFERNGFVYEVDKFVWDETCRYLRKWIDEGRNPLPIAVNVSRFDVFHADFVDVLVAIMKKHNISADMLRLEITESAFSKSTEHIVAIVRQLVELGFTVEIDDFGSGYSSLNTLKSVPAQILKLDMRFFDDDGGTGRGGNIIDSVVRMAKWLGMSVIAEGVEKEHHATYLTSIGCSYVQGFLYAKPMPATDYEAHCKGADKEEHLLTLETVENLDKNEFWNPESIDSIMFSSYVGAACICEYRNGKLELMRVTDKLVALFGGELTASDLIKMNIADYIADKEAMKLAIAEAWNGGDAICECMFTGLPRGGRELLLRCTMRVIATVGDRGLVYCLNEDITAQHQAEKLAARTMQQLQMVMDNINGGISAVTIGDDFKVDVLFSNDQFYTMFGYTREVAEREKFNMVNVVHPDDLEMIKARVNKVFTDRVGQYEYRCIKRDGSVIHVRCSASLTRIEGIDQDVLISNICDITTEANAIEQLRISEKEKRLALQHGSNIVGRFTVKERILAIEDSTAHEMDIPSAFVDVPYGPAEHELVPPESKKAFIDFFDEIIHGNESGRGMFQFKTNIGLRWIEAHYTTIFSDAGEPVSAVVSFVDVTERVDKEAIYKKWQQSLDEKAPDSYTLFRCNLNRSAPYDKVDGTLLNIAFDMQNMTFNDITARYAAEYVPEKDRERYAALLNSDALLANYYRGKRVEVMEYCENQPDGSTRWLRLTVELVEFPNSTDVEVYLMYEDIDEEKRAELRIIELSERDSLTGLLNRAAFTAQVSQTLRVSGADAMHALIMFDVDNFKRVNDTFGHAAGDQTLIETANAVRASLRHGDYVARIGGDEFVAFLNDIPCDAIAEVKAKRICELVRKSFGDDVKISSSVGIAIAPRDGIDFETLYNNADAALYHVKNTGKDNYAFYSDNLNGEPRASTAVGAAAAAKPKVETKRRMLVVDDDIIQHKIVAQNFAEEYIVDSVYDGENALSRLNYYGTSISVVLLDLSMPGMNGFEVLRTMQESEELSHIPVIVVSVSDDQQTCIHAIRAGASDFVTKPFDAALLRVRAHSAISRAENERLRAKNIFLEQQNSEIAKYKELLKQHGIETE